VIDGETAGHHDQKGKVYLVESVLDIAVEKYGGEHRLVDNILKSCSNRELMDHRNRMYYWERILLKYQK